TTYNTGKSAVSTLGGAISDRRREAAYKKEMKSYQKSVKEEDSLLRQIEKEKEKHRKKRLSDKTDVKVPKIMQSHNQPDNDEKSDRSEEHTSELQSRFDRVCRLLLETKEHE